MVTCTVCTQSEDVKSVGPPLEHRGVSDFLSEFILRPNGVRGTVLGNIRSRGVNASKWGLAAGSVKIGEPMFLTDVTVRSLEKVPPRFSVPLHEAPFQDVW